MEDFEKFVIASDYVPHDGFRDAADAIQRLIDEHPNRTIYFPDGTYLLSHPVLTPANPRRGVSLHLADYAVLKASDNWTGAEAMVRLGAKDPANDIDTNGSNYRLSGGVIDGNYRADGVSVDGGRETFIADVSIKHTRIGLHIKHGANNGSSDADVQHVNIVGTGETDSIGLLIEGADNTFTNMRIAKVFTGVHICSGGNALRNIHPLFIHTPNVNEENYEQGCAFLESCSGNILDYCYSDHFATGFHTRDGISNIHSNCFVMWYRSYGKHHIAFQADGTFESTLINFRVAFIGGAMKRSILYVDQAGGSGTIFNLLYPPKAPMDHVFEEYMK